jgi:hypothetical protein
MRYLSFAVHYPKSDHVADLLKAMYRLADAANSGEEPERPLQIAAFHDEANERILAVSIWPSQQAFQAAAQRMLPVIASTPFDDWERSPREVYALNETPSP